MLGFGYLVEEKSGWAAKEVKLCMLLIAAGNVTALGIRNEWQWHHHRAWKRKEGSAGSGGQGDHIILWDMDDTSAKTDKRVMWEVWMTWKEEIKEEEDHRKKRGGERKQTRK